MTIDNSAVTDHFSLDVTEIQNKNCSDVYGNVVSDGMQYVPDDDPCRTCHCHDGQQVMCKSVQCSPPTCRYVEMIKTECCKFICIDLPDEIFGNKFNRTRYIDTNLNETNTNRASFGVRLVASIVTSSLIVFLLIFMLHRLRRRRRMMINIRRLNNERSENDDLTYMTTTDHHVDLRFELPPYEDLPPPPYSPIKPWGRITRDDESPPPYEGSTSNIINRPTSLDVNRNLPSTTVNNGCQLNSRQIEDVNLRESEGTNQRNQSEDEENQRSRESFEMMNVEESPPPPAILTCNDGCHSLHNRRETTTGKKCFVVEDSQNPTSKRKKKKCSQQIHNIIVNSNEASTFLPPTLLPLV